MAVSFVVEDPTRWILDLTKFAGKVVFVLFLDSCFGQLLFKGLKRWFASHDYFCFRCFVAVSYKIYLKTLPSFLMGKFNSKLVNL